MTADFEVLAAAGIPAFPVTDAKRPCFTGFYEQATSDAEALREWREQYANPWWGIPAGEQSGLVAVDLDPRNADPPFEGLGYAETWERILHNGAALLMGAVEQQSPHGWHALFAWARGFADTHDLLAKGVDTKGGPPDSGRHYFVAYEPARCALARGLGVKPPQPLLAALYEAAVKPRAERDAKRRAAAEAIANAPPLGAVSRSQAANHVRWMAGRIADAKSRHDAMLAAMCTAHGYALGGALTQAELVSAERIIADAFAGARGDARAEEREIAGAIAWASENAQPARPGWDFVPKGDA